MAFVDPSIVSQLVQNEILSKATWGFPVRGLFSSPPGSPSGTIFIQDQIDQLLPRFPFKPITGSMLDRPVMTDASTDLFIAIDTSEPEPGEIPNIGLSLSTSSRSMYSIGANLQISTAALGTEHAEQIIVELEQALVQILRRFLSVSLIYGGTVRPINSTSPTAFWTYYEYSPSVAAWNQSAGFPGLLEMAGSPIDPAVDGWSTTGYTEILSGPLTLSAIDGFLSHFRGANNGNIDYLVMNSAMRDYYLSLWHDAASPQHPQYVMDPVTGRYVVAHCGIPILVNDYIVNHDPDPSNFLYISSQNNPENLSSPSGVESSIYALVLGEEKGGVFGIYPASFGSSPMKIERTASSQTKDSIQIQGTIQAGLVSKTNAAVGRLAGIQFP